MKAQRFFAILGIIIGMIMAMIGITWAVDGSGVTIKYYDKQFGADYYTEQYNVTKTASNNIAEFHDHCYDGFCIVLILGGLLTSVKYASKLSESYSKIEYTYVPLNNYAPSSVPNEQQAISNNTLPNNQFNRLV